METLKSLSELQGARKQMFNKNIGEQFGSLIKAIKKMPCNYILEKGKLAKIRVYKEHRGYFVPFISSVTNAVSICFVCNKLDGYTESHYKQAKWEEWTIEEFITQYGSFNKSQTFNN
ncbi:hypothetical protein N8508_00215 [bacterium]|nr:hypothetical protein [bacterium]